MTAFFSTVHTVFTGIVLQAVPFMLLGALLSSALYAFVPDRLLIKLFPKKYGLGFLTALFAGALFPVCECAAVPLMRSLIKKGVAMPIAVTFMLASPIVNPISIVSTLYAFPQQPSVAFYRLFFGLLIAFTIGLLLLFYPEEKYLKEDFDTQPTAQPHSLDSAVAAFRLATGRSTQNSRSEAQSDNFEGTATESKAHRLQVKVYVLLMHTCSEFFTTGPFLILGAFITALIRAAVPQEFFSITSGSAAGSLLVMMLFAFVFSACSTSDAFIARSFLNRFSFGSILGFLVYGPMMDIKNLFMLLSLFKKRFVIELTLIITAINFIGISVLIRLVL
ncbi:permease [Treponema sp. OMZ 857]|uniref:permease n=1 Tax=Treponema sp. OMZ 857 TaxID=1643513 RepID=UPI0020A38DE2|nr:permease [Treponema sp. OMZ 857]UTC42676.1 permease [Treponema sp. OMZ 857]